MAAKAKMKARIWPSPAAGRSESAHPMTTYHGSAGTEKAKALTCN
jgi:hypothetical protein